MYIRWNDSSKFWTNSMGTALNKNVLAGLDSNFRTTMMIPGRDDKPTEVIDILVIVKEGIPTFIRDDHELSVLDMLLVERCSIAHPIHAPVLCTPALHHIYPKMNRDSFLKVVRGNVGDYAKRRVMGEGAFTKDELSSYIPCNTISFNDLNKLQDSCVVFVTDGDEGKGKRWLYVETCQYEYLCRPHEEQVWVRLPAKEGVKQPWVTWNENAWITVSEDPGELARTLEHHFC